MYDEHNIVINDNKYRISNEEIYNFNTFFLPTIVGLFLKIKECLQNL